MKNDEKKIYYVPAPTTFQDTGFVSHGFGNKSLVGVEVVKSNDSGGFALRMLLKDDNGDVVCDITLDRFAGLCLVDALVKNLLNQEELNYLREKEMYAKLNHTDEFDA